MSDWINGTVGDLIQLSRGIDLPEQQRKLGAVPIMGSFGVTGYQNRAACSGPGVTVGRSGGSIGVVSYTTEDYWPLNTALYVKDFKGNDPRFCYYFLQTLDLARLNSGSAQPSLNRNFVHPVETRFPDRDNQIKIAALLGALDDKIELNRRVNETLEAMARAIFKDWFVDFGPTRAKIEGRAPYLTPDIWALFPDRLDADGEPGDWTHATIDDACAAIYSGGTPATGHANYWNGGIPWLSSGETRHPVVTETERSITELGVQDSSTRLARLGSTVIASAGQGGTRGQASFLAIDTYINQSVIAATANPNVVSSTFLFFDLSSRYEELRRLSDGNSSRGSLTTKIVGGLTVTLPSQDLVQAFHEIAEPVLRRMAGNLRENRTLATIRDRLLPKLMSGEIRIRHAEAIAADAA